MARPKSGTDMVEGMVTGDDTDVSPAKIKDIVLYTLPKVHSPINFGKTRPAIISGFNEDGTANLTILVGHPLDFAQNADQPPIAARLLVATVFMGAVKYDESGAEGTYH